MGPLELVFECWRRTAFDGGRHRRMSFVESTNNRLCTIATDAAAAAAVLRYRASGKTRNIRYLHVRCISNQHPVLLSTTERILPPLQDVLSIVATNTTSISSC